MIPWLQSEMGRFYIGTIVFVAALFVLGKIAWWGLREIAAAEFDQIRERREAQRDTIELPDTDDL